MLTINLLRVRDSYYTVIFIIFKLGEVILLYESVGEVAILQYAYIM